MAPKAGSTLHLDGRRALLNPGSVGQPRDGDPSAAWLELDTDGGVVTWRRAAYDVERARSAILDAGLPARLGDRLRHGV